MRMTAAEATALLEGATLGGYTLVEYRGSGAFAHVFRAQDGASRVVAVKVLDLHAGTEQRREFDNEGDLLARLDRSSSVVDLLKTGTDQVLVCPPGSTVSVPVPVRFHVLEYADNCLDRLLAFRDLLSWPDRLHLYRGVVRGVHQMHLASVAHRDTKAANSLVFERRKACADAKVADLGRSCDLAVPPSAPPIMYLWGRGDPLFAPPEMLFCLGEATRTAHLAADLFGVGSLLFEVVTGQGLTAVALGPGVDFLDQIDVSRLLMENERRDRFDAALPGLRARYEQALHVLGGELPPVLRQPATELVRRLCDPDPARRGPRALPGSRTALEPFLWVLDRVDAMVRAVELAGGHSRRHARRKGA